MFTLDPSEHLQCVFPSSLASEGDSGTGEYALEVIGVVGLSGIESFSLGLNS